MSYTQDNDVTILRKKPVSTNVMRSEAAVSAARKAGQEITSDKKAQATNYKSSMDASKAAKIDRETEDFHIEKVFLYSIPYHPIL